LGNETKPYGFFLIAPGEKRGFRSGCSFSFRQHAIWLFFSKLHSVASLLGLEFWLLN
jgi:hypothetical protein